MIRTVVALVLALIASLRSGGIALACEIATAPTHGGMQMANASMPSHDTSSSQGCNEPERVRECALMAACAPAVFSSAVDAPTMTGAPTSDAIAVSSRAPAPVDRSPEPPPPRA